MRGGAVGDLDAHRAVQGEAAAMLPLAAEAGVILFIVYTAAGQLAVRRRSLRCRRVVAGSGLRSRDVGTGGRAEGVAATSAGGDAACLIAIAP